MREMKDSGIEWIGTVPEDWEVSKIKYNLYRCEPRNPGNKQVLSLYRELGIVPKNSRNDNHNVTSEDTSNYKYVEAGDFVVNKMKAWQGSVAVSEYEGIVSPAYYVYKFSTSKFGKRYFHYLLRSCYKDEFMRLSGGIRVGQWDLPSLALDNTLSVIPPLSEQNKIAAFLDKKCGQIDKLSEKLQGEIQKLQEYKKSLISETVTQGLDKNVAMKDSGIEWIGTVPEDWEVSKIDVLYNLRNTKVSDRDYQALSVTKQGILPQLENVAKTNDGDSRKLVMVNDFVINSRSDRRGSCGISVYEGSVSLINTVLMPKEEIKMNNQYYDWLFHTTNFSDEFYKWGHGIVDDLWTTGWQEMRKIVVTYPPLSEQNKIAAFLDDKCSQLDAVIAKKQQQVSILADYKKSLIYEYVTGKKEVTADEVH